MHPPKTLCWILLIVLVPHLVGCVPGRADWYGVKAPLARTQEEARLDHVVRVYSSDGTFVDLYGVWADSIAVTGFLATDREEELSEPIVVEIPTTDVVKMEEFRGADSFSEKWSPENMMKLALFLAIIGGISAWAGPLWSWGT